MIHYIKGIITGQDSGKICVENNGIGYEVNVPDGRFAYLPDSFEEVCVYIKMIVREDDVSLYGFADKAELSMFELLMTVSGVGAKAALSILSALSVAEIRKAVFFEDDRAISRANGVGKKIAQRVCLELKDKVAAPDNLEKLAATSSKKPANSAKDEAVKALLSLGFTRTEALSFVMAIDDDNLSTEEYIKASLRQKR